jgi:VCBS repeat-containing protein
MRRFLLTLILLSSLSTFAKTFYGPPVANNDVATTNEDVVLYGTTVLANDTDPDPGATLTAVLVSGPANGTLSLASDGTYTYTPAANFNGSDAFTYKVTDGTEEGNTATVTITVVAVNDAPVAVNDAASTNEDNAVTVNVLGNDSDVEGNTLSVTGATMVSGLGIVSVVSNQVVFTPAADFNGSASFTYTVSDGNGGTATATVSVNVAAVNDVPVASGQSVTVAEDGSVDITLSGNDVDGDALTFTPGSITQGTLTPKGGGVYTFTPAPNFNGTSSFTFTVSDGTATSAPATVNITVTAVNDAPVAINNTASVAEDAILTGTSVLANDTDPDGAVALTAVLVTGPSNGALTLNANGTYTYTPNANFNGTDQFTYRASDGIATSNEATVLITITAVNDAPVAQNDTKTTSEDVVLNSSVTATDVDGGTLTYTMVSGPANATLTLNANGTYTFTPNANFNGSTSFTYTASDGTATSNTATVTISVTPVNDAPTATNDVATVAEDAVLNASTVLANDADVDAGTTLTAVLVSGTTSGTLTLNANGTYTYTPNANFNGTDQFTYRASDGSAQSSIATVTITVTAVNDAPTVSNVTKNGTEDQTLIFAATDFTGSFTDADGTALNKMRVTSLPANGSLRLNGVAVTANQEILLAALGQLTFVPNANWNGTTSFGWNGSDGTVYAAAGALVNITIAPVNDSPIAGSNTATTQEDNAVTINVLSNDSDPDGDVLAVTPGTVTGGAATGTILVNADKTITFTPAANFNGTATFTYSVSDGNGGIASATVTVTVTAVNDAPTVSDVTKTGNEEATVTFAATDFTSKYSDVEGTSMTKIQITSLPANGTLKDGNKNVQVGDEITVSSLGGLTFVPNANWNGTTSFGWNGSDGIAFAVTGALVNITIAPVNDAPSFTKGANQTHNEDAGAISVNGWATAINDGDPELTQTLTFNVINNNNALFSVQPTIAANGTLSYTLAPGVSGTATVTVVLQDDGSGTAPNVNTSTTQTFTITVNAINDAPVFTKGADQTVNEDAGAQTVSGWATGIDDGDADQAQTLTFTVTNNTNTALFSVQPTIAADGTLSYTPAPNVSGTATVTVILRDNGLSTSPNVNASTTQTFTITVNPVNDAPSFNLIGNQTVNEDAGAQSVSGAVTNMSAGPANESSQTLTLTATNDNNALFSVQPSIAADGTLTYTPAPNANGSAIVTVILKDNGGTANGGVDQIIKTFIITVNAMPEPPIVADFTTSSVLEQGILILSVSDFTSHYTPGDGGAMESIKITSLAAGGVLKLDGVPVMLDQVISLADLTAGKLTFTPTVNFSGDAAFGWSAFDGEVWADKSATGKIPVISNGVRDPELIFNEFFVQPPEASQDEFFELLNTGNKPINVDCYSLVVYFNEDGTTGGGTAKGFYVLDLPNITVNPGQYLVGAADNPFDFQGKTGQAANFSWNTFKDAAGNLIPGGSLKKYTLTNGSYVESDPRPVIDLFFQNKDSKNGGLRYAMFLFNGDAFVNGFAGATNSGILPSELTGMPTLNYSTNCKSNTMALSEVAPSEFVIETTGNANGYIRKYDGICGEWEKSSSGGNNNTNQVEHTPGRTNGSRAYNANTVDGLTTTAQLNVCGTKLEVQISGAKYDYIFPVTVLVYEDYGTLGILDNADIYVTSIQIDNASSTFYIIDGSWDVDKNYLLVYKVNIGCVDRMIKPSFPGFTSAQKSFCGNIIDYSLAGGTGDDPLAYLPATVAIYGDLNGNGIVDSGEPLVGTPDPITSYSSNFLPYTLPAGTATFDNYVIVYTSTNQNCISRTAKVTKVDGAGSVETAQFLTCGSQASGGDDLIFDVTGIGNLSAQFDFPITVKVYTEDTTNKYDKVGELDADDIVFTTTTFATVEELSKKYTTPLGLPVILEFITNRGCAVKRVPLERACGPLPINLSFFTATRNKEKVLLKWETLTEQNNRGFNVQRNTNGVWENRAFVFSAASGGNSNAPLTYSFNDPNSEKGISQYRIQQVDFDGKVSYTPIRVVNGLDQLNRTIVYPNPSEDGKVNVVFGDQGTKKVLVSDLSGRIIRQYGNVQHDLVIDKLEVGMYLIRITDLSTAETSVEKVIIKMR